jgi:hypothetical protein
VNTPIQNGGPAFPRPASWSNDKGFHPGYVGMTLRDWFAGKASEADILLNVPETCGELAELFKVSLHGLNSGHTLRARCEARYAYADAMIAAREAKQ